MEKSIARVIGTRKLPFVSIVVPLLNEEESLPELFSQITETMKQWQKAHPKASALYEIIFVDDGSTDGSYAFIQQLHKMHPAVVRAIRFRKNFGKSAALTAAFHIARGELVITMDADLQDDPKEIPALIEALGDSYDLVSGWKKKRRDSIIFTLPSKLANAVTSMLTGLKIHDLNCGLKIYRKDVVKELKLYGDLYRYIPILAHQAGFRVGEKAVEHRPRKFGYSKYTVGKFYRGFLDLITVLFTANYIQRPLHLFGIWGMISFFIGGLIDGYLSLEWFFGLTALSNRPLFLVGFLFLIIGVQFISLGLLGEMITRQERNVESYSIRETLQ